MGQQLVPLSTFCTFTKGLSYQGAHLDKDGPILMGIGTIKEGGGFRSQKLRTYNGPHKPEHRIHPGEVYVAMTNMAEETRRFLGSTARLPDINGEYGILTHHVSKVNWKTDESIMQDFLYWVMRSHAFHQHCRNHGIGTTVYSVKGKDAEKFLVPAALNDELRTLTQLLNDLEQQEQSILQVQAGLKTMIQALYRSWFVDFDPVLAKVAGNAPPGMDAETGQLFPESIEESKNGKVPTGWRYVFLEDLATLTKTTLNPKSRPDERFLHYSIPAFDDGEKPDLSFGDEIESNKFIVPEHCVLLSKLNPKWNRVWLPTPSDEVVQIASTEFLPWVPKAGVSLYFLYSMMISQPFRWQMDSRISGTTGSHQRVRPDDCAKIPCLMPSREVMTTFHEKVEVLFEQLRFLSGKLTDIRTIKEAQIQRLLS